MVKCDICGKEFKNPQGLRGHKFWCHEDRDNNQQLTVHPAAEQPLSELESRLEQVEELTRVNRERLTEQLEQYAHQLDKQLKALSQRVELSPTKAEYRLISRRVAELGEQVSRNSGWLTPDEIGLIVSETLHKPPAFLVDLKKLIRQVNENQGVINWVRKKFDLVKRGAK